MNSGPDEPDPPAELNPGATSPTRGGSLDAETERLFELAGEGWSVRLRHAHATPVLGRLGAYELLGEVGRGGQGEVYKAIQPGTGRVVALKRVAGLGLAPDAVLLARFTREVEALTRLSHANVVSVFALEVIDGHSLLVMEFVDGRTFDHWADTKWASGTEPFKAILTAFAEVCDGIGHAHQRGVLHRDIKPSNILVTGEDRPKVLDFGIARLLNEQAATGASPAWTVTGFAGTPAYASPEQLRSGPGGIDTRSDVYSLGILLFRVLTGEEAFDPKGGIAAVMKLAGEGQVRAPSRIRRGLSSECDWIVRKATALDPARRYQSVDALADDVRRLLDGRPVLAYPAGAGYRIRRAVQRRPWLSLGVATSAVVIVALGVTAAAQAARLSVRSRDLAMALAEATTQRTKSEESRQREHRVNGVLLKTLTGTTNYPDYLAPSHDSNAVRVLTQLVDELTPEDGDDINLEARMRLGFALRGVHNYAAAETRLAEAEALSERIDDPSDKRATSISIQRSLVLRLAGTPEAALNVIDAAIHRTSGHPATIFVAELHWERLCVLFEIGQPADEWIAYTAQTIARFDAHPTHAYERSRVRESASDYALAHKQFKQAEAWAREAVELAVGGAAGAGTRVRYQWRQAYALKSMGRWEEAERVSRAATAHQLTRDSGSSLWTHRCVRQHAEILHRLGRFDEAAPRWELTLLRPLVQANPNQIEIAQLRLALAAARLAVGEDAAGRVALAQAVSRGRTTRNDDREIRDVVVKVEAALRENGWRLDESLRPALGENTWLLDAFIQTTPSPAAEEPTKRATSKAGKEDRTRHSAWEAECTPRKHRGKPGAFEPPQQYSQR